METYGNLGSVLSSQGRVEEAEQAFKMALKLRPNMAEVHYNLSSNPIKICNEKYNVPFEKKKLDAVSRDTRV
uniref:TPR_REGION domain-containing protein n=1 Tax=Rhodnius prolixus TaxID=13249 RepID=T1IFC5_RHOPR